MINSAISNYYVAQNGFARLMGLEDSTLLTTENEGLDSGLGDIPPTSEKKVHSSTDNLEPLETEMSDIVERATSRPKTRSKKRISKLENASFHPLLNPEKEHAPLKKPSRKKQNKDLDPDKILEKKQKKSVEKVAEWLMKVPTEGSLQLEKADKDADDSDSCSSSSTIDVKQHISDVNPKRQDRAKALEEQVFGAVYKRERRGNRTNSPPLHAYVEPPPTTETHAAEIIVRKRNNITPAEFCKKSNSEDRNDTEEQQMIEEGYDTSKKAEQIQDLEENEMNKYEEGIKNNGKEVSDIEPQKTDKRSKKGVPRYCALQEVDSDLQKQAMAASESIEQNTTDKRRGKKTKLEKGKPSRVSKSLVLVPVPNGETSPESKPRTEVQVQIENYPSSEDQETPIIRSTRRSRRLQIFAEEVQEVHKKANMKASVSRKESSVANQTGDAKSGTSNDEGSPKNGKMTKLANRNGCIYDDEDLGGIQNMDPIQNPSGDHKESTEALNDEMLHSQASAACPTSTSPTEAAVLHPTLESGDAINQFPNNIYLETTARDMKCTLTENNEDKNDSEMDTEQLLRSFKATKRKSFHLGGPNVKKSRSLDNIQGPDAEEDLSIGSVDSMTKRKIAPEITNQDLLGDHENSSCSNLISLSNSPVVTRKAVVVDASETCCSGENGAVNLGLSRTSVSSALSPNKVSKREIESPQLSVVPQVVDSGLRFTAVEHEELSEASYITGSQLDAGSANEPRHSISRQYIVNPADHIVIAESSLTPDGLVPPIVQIVNETKSSNVSGELSSHSSIKSNPKKKRRAQRLESLSESSDISESEDLPTLSQIFRRSAPPARTQDHGDLKTNRCDAANVTADPAQQLNHPPACPSPDCVNSSQASVDLFGTPDECK